ncbi:Transcription factor bHLH25 [Striga hermonthica]|uniref:Transcription factor bHLH25 n=1 Tax=Striga hermonthica TaxID=68872 RepID=A0A9N7RQJ3_STRHE|nr:Transcription factor bHLH25 [Striga hermonthica]
MDMQQDSSAISWLSEMGLDDPIFTDDFDFTDTFGDEWAAMLGPDLDSPPSLSPDPKNSSTSSTLVNIPSTNSITSLSALPTDTNNNSEPPPRKLQKPNGFSGFSSATAAQDHRPSSTPIILNFGAASANLSPKNQGPAAGPTDAADEEAAIETEAGKQPGEPSKRADNAKRRTGRAGKGPQTYDHIVAERKRREQLSQRFLTLSTIVPGLKKMDKTSVLGDAIKYLKHLQERVQILEEKTTKKMMESVVLVRKSRAHPEDDNSAEDNIPGSDEQALPEIEARVCGTQILIRIHCEKRKGILANLMNQLENFNLAIVSTNVTTFGCFALDITICTEMGKEFSLTMNELEGEILRSYVDQYNKACIEIPSASDEINAGGLVKSLRTGACTRYLAKNGAMTYDEVLRQCQKYVNLKETEVEFSKHDELPK